MVTAPINTRLNSGSLSCVATVGTPRWPHETTGTARADWRWGVRGCRCHWLCYLRGGGSPLPAGLIICAISGWLCFAIRILVISREKAAGSSTSAFTSASGLSGQLPVVVRIPAGPLGSLKCDPPKGIGRRLQKKWLIKDNGNEHFAAVFLDKGWSAGLHLCKDRHRFVFTQGAFPFL